MTATEPRHYAVVYEEDEPVQEQPPGPRLFTVDEFLKMGEMGLFPEGERVELLEGRVCDKMSPQGTPHAFGIRAVEEALRHAFREGFDVRVQLPIVATAISLPEPDVSVVKGSFRDFIVGHPEHPVLVVEVSDTTTATDRSFKAGLYAKAGIEEYWILNLNERLLEVHREPVPVSEAVHGFHYQNIEPLGIDGVVSPLASPKKKIKVSSLFP